MADKRKKQLIPLTDEQRDIVSAHMPDIIRQANAIATRKGMDADVVLSGVSMAYIDSIKRFNESAGVKFTTFASRRSWGQVTDDGRTHYRWMKIGRDKQPHARQPAIDEHGDEIEMGQTTDATSVDDRDAFEAIIRPLDVRSRMVMRLYYVAGMTMKEIGKVLDCSEPLVSLLHKNAIEILKSQR